MAEHPRFITFEGVDGAGKSTHVAWFAAALAERTGIEVVVSREPGGTALGASLRALLLAQPMHVETEALLMFADRRQHVADVIEPALARGAWVVCDRFSDASFAYQGGGRGLSFEKLAVLRDWVHPHLRPSLTVLFDLAPAAARARLDAARDRDRFEGEALEFFDRVRAAYLRMAGEEPGRWHVVEAANTVSTIRRELENIIVTRCS